VEGRAHTVKVAIGSINPTKVEAARRAVSQVWPEAEVIPVAVASGVSEQPMSDEETIQGAINRARAARAAVDAEIGMGVEGGVEETAFGMFVGGWAAVVHRDGRTGIGAGGRLQLPDQVARQIRNGGELGPAMDRLSGLQNVKHHQGAIGIFTGGLVTRTEALERSLVYALARFIATDYYSEE
jgi:inosine/xanthosine triphosphatase